MGIEATEYPLNQASAGMIKITMLTNMTEDDFTYPRRNIARKPNPGRLARKAARGKIGGMLRNRIKTSVVLNAVTICRLRMKLSKPARRLVSSSGKRGAEKNFINAGIVIFYNHSCFLIVI
jgi:hypothetical protein